MSRLCSVSLVLVLAVGSGSLYAQNAAPAGSDPATPATVTPLPASSSRPSPGSFDQVVDRIVEREHFYVAQMRHMHPMVETYIQNMKTDRDLGAVPVSDRVQAGAAAHA